MTILAPISISFSFRLVSDQSWIGSDVARVRRNRKAADVADRMLHLLGTLDDRPRVLVIGGGSVGSGAAKLYSSDQIDLIGTDVYDLPNVAVLADAHFLPFKDGSFDGVWIQAVLEHVLDPWMTVRESRRVLKPSGLVYADTAFMQQVHEGAYDFARFTVSGHRWLFKNF